MAAVEAGVNVRERNKIMKKTIGLLLAVVLVIGVIATAAFAGSGDGTRDYVGAGAQAGNGYAWGFTELAGDGINDNFVDTNNDGVCDNFVDLDEDGINDARGTNAKGMGAGLEGRGQGQGACDGANFVDDDGDGVCDNAGSGVGGQRMGMSGGRGIHR
jgi:hypothetical protein